MKILEKVNLIGGAIATVGTTLFGTYWFLFLAFLVLNVVDYVTGIIKAKMYKQESSSIGAKGIVKKVSYWLVIGISFFVGYCFVQMGDMISVNLSFMPLLGWYTLAIYLINEIRSILENCVVMGVSVPDYLIKGLKIVEDVIDKKTGSEEQ